MWIITYHHRHGTSAWPVYEEPDLEAEAEKLDDFEPDRDEFLDLHGPFDSPATDMLPALEMAETLIAADIIRDDLGCLDKVRAAIAKARK